MNQLPEELVLEVIKHMSCCDAVRLGATCREYHGLVKEAIQRKEMKRSVLDSFGHVLYLMITKNRVVRSGRAGFVNHLYQIPPNNHLTQGTRAFYLCPSMWTTYLQGSLQPDDELVPIMISISLHVRVHPERLRNWQFRFRIAFTGENASMLYEEFDEEALFQLTTREERRNAALTLLASWYSHAQDTLGGRRLRSHRNKAWLPTRLPCIYNYMQAAYTPMRAFVCNLENDHPNK